VDHRQAEYRIRPTDWHEGHYDIYSVDQVAGLVQGSVEHRDYMPFEVFGRYDGEKPVYTTPRRRSPVSDSLDTFLALTYPASARLSAQETLSIDLTCTNGFLPEQLQLGDISQPTSTSPELMEFRNILPPTAPSQPPVGSNTQWHFLSHLALNYLSIANRENIKELLGLYVFPESRDRANIEANRKRIDGIRDLTVTAGDRIVSGYIMRGNTIRMKLRQDHFASPGDMFLFGSIMDYLFSAYSSINSFTHFFVEESTTGETYSWTPRIGERFLV